MNKKTLGTIYAIVAQFFILGYFIFSKLSLNYYNVFTTVILWFGFSTLFSFLMIIFSGKTKKYFQTLKKYWRILFITYLIGTASVLTSFWAIDLIGPSLKSFLSQINTIFIVLTGIFLLKEKLNIYEIISGIIVIIGVFLISFSKGEFIVEGVLIILLHAIVLTISRYLIKKKLKKIDPLLLVNYRALFVTSFVFLIAISTGQFNITLSKGLFFATFPSIFSVIFLHLFTYKAYQLIEMSKVALFGTLSPFLVVITAYFVFKEIPTTLQMFGGSIIIIGVISLILSRPKPKLERVS